MRQVIVDLQRLRRRSRGLLLAQRLSVMMAWILGLALALVLLDFLLRLPGTVRLVLLLGAAGGLAYAIWSYLRPAVRFRPGLTELALRAERVFPAVSGRLASSVEFAVSGTDKTNALAARSVLDTERRLAGEKLARVISGERTWRYVSVLLAVGAVVTVAGSMSSAATQTGLARLLLPYGSAQWPARTGVESLMSEVVPETRVHPRGQALPLRARVTKGDPSHVDARYRLKVGDHFGPWQRIVLTHQGSAVHERLVDATAEAIELYFETEDARTQRERITLVSPPAVRRAALTINSPSYATAWYQTLDVDLGPGLDDRAVTDSPSLVGSDVTLVLHLNKAVPGPPQGEALATALGWGEGAWPTCTVDDVSPDRWTIRWRLARTRSLSLTLQDEYGLGNAEPIGYRIEAVEDRPPGVTILEPESDEPVLATAVVPLEAEARDDVAVSTMGIEAGLRRHDLEPTAEEPLWGTFNAVEAPTGTVEAELALAAFELSEGDVVLVRGVAEDVFELDGERHPVVRSPARRLRIISELDFARRLRRELGVVRQNAIRIEALQEELQDDVRADGVQPGVARAQAKIGERIATQRQAVNRIGRRMDLNRLDDEQMTELVRQVGDVLDFAGQAANRAVEAIEHRTDELRRAPGGGQPAAGRTGLQGQADQGRLPAAEGDEQAPDEGSQAPEGLNEPDLREPAEADRPIVEAQQEVREELADLITLLDRDEDTWVATRWLEDLMEAQAKLEAETSDLGRKTIGRSFDELTEGQQSQCRRIAERQEDLGEQGRQLLEDLRTRARDLDDVDPAAADAMRAAAATGERQELIREMDNAAERLGQNQLRTARDAQQAARRALERMLQQLRETKRANAEELLRRLASLIESIQRLVAVQESELAALAAAVHAGDLVGRDRGMIRLNQNTQAVAVQARAAGQESRRIARVLDRAADAQGAAVVALRERPVNADDARAAENRSLDLLREARELAEKLADAVEQRETWRQREELIAAYRAYAERQIAVRAETIELVGDEALERRQLVDARGLGRAQDEIRVGLDTLRAATPGLHEARVFTHVHGVIDELSRSVTESLLEGIVDVEVTDRQQRIADSIGRVVEALEELIQPPPPSEFARQQGGGG
ncbi:MAG: hypothetical protein ACYS0G_13550, partial [Planctomycetota bacterium]